MRLARRSVLALVTATLLACSGGPGSPGDGANGNEGADGSVEPTPDGATPDARGDEAIVVPSHDAAAQDGTLPDGTLPDALAPDDAPSLDATAPETSTFPEAAPLPDAGPLAEAGCPTGDLQCSGVCVPSDVHNCGTCGHDCTNLPHVAGAPSCTAAGACAFPSSACAAGWADCNGNPADGCEADVTTPAHCGSCTTACPATEPVCAASGGTYACATGCASATASLCSGACVDTTSNPNDCGACGKVCGSSVANAQPTCAASKCGFACNSGFAGCPASAPATCVDEQHDPANCGACGKVCPAPTSGPGQAACTAGACAIHCNAGYSACSVPGATAATCVNEQADDANCGGCGVACGGGEHCVAGKCQCTNNQHLCGSPAACVNDDVNACGASCTRCTAPVDAAPSCDGTSCHWTCNAGFTGCPASNPAACDNLATDNANCGACGHVCTGGETCQGGACVCPAGQTFCTAACTSTATDSANCGACGHACTGGETCQGGTCECPAGQTLCGGTCVNEASDASNCGACGHGCLGGTCSGGQCQPVTLATFSGNGLSITLDANDVYFTSNTSLYSCPKTGCASPSLLAPAKFGIVLYGQPYLWVTEQNSPSTGTSFVYQYLTGGTVNDVVYTNLGGAAGMATDGANVYVGYAAGIDEIPINNPGSSKQLFANGASAYALAVDPNASTGSWNLYAAEYLPSGRILAIRPGVEDVFAGPETNPVSISVSGSRVFWANLGTEANNFTDGSVVAMSTASGGPTTLATGSYCASLSTDASYVYFNCSQTLYRCPLAGCGAGPTALAGAFDMLGPTLTNDATALYWVTESGALMKLAK